MQKRTKDRVIGIVVVVAIAAIFLPILFYHPLPGLKGSNLKTTMPNAPQEVKVVYDLPLNNQKAERKKSNLDGFDMTSVEDMRKQAAKTQEVSAAILRPKQSGVIAKKLIRDGGVEPSSTKTLNTEATVPEAWVVQLATFGEQAHAKELLKQLRQQNMEAYIREVKLEDKSLFRVYVGPYIQYDKATSLQKYLQHTYKMKGIVKKYTL